MPLPPAPTKRAALLSTDALNAPARSSAKAGRKSGPVDVLTKPRPQPLEKHPVVETEHPTAFLEKTRPSPVKSLATHFKKETPAPAAKLRKPKPTGPTKLFVLDTNVLMHDPMCLFRFEEHDIFLPMIVLEELDGHKKGMSEVARNARQTSRTLDALAGAQGADIAKGLSLDTTGHSEARGCLLFQTRPLDYTLPMSLPPGKADNQILGVVEALRKEQAPREVVLVSKDINMRVKARALGLLTDDYQNDKTLEDGDLLCRLISGLAKAKHLKAGSKAATLSTVSPARLFPVCLSTSLSTLRHRASHRCMRA